MKTLIIILAILAIGLFITLTLTQTSTKLPGPVTSESGFISKGTEVKPDSMTMKGNNPTGLKTELNSLMVEFPGNKISLRQILSLSEEQSGMKISVDTTFLDPSVIVNLDSSGTKLSIAEIFTSTEKLKPGAVWVKRKDSYILINRNSAKENDYFIDPNNMKQTDKLIAINLTEQIVQDTLSVSWKEISFLKGIDKLSMDTGVQIIIDPGVLPVLEAGNVKRTADLEIRAPVTKIISTMIRKLYPETSSAVEVKTDGKTIRIIKKIENP